MPSWKISRPASVTWRRWEDDWIIYHSVSGDTIQLDPIAAVTLMCLEAEPFDLAALTAQVAVELDLPVGETLSTKLAGVLDELARLGLIEPIGS